jgi:hypothetical protein
LQSLSASAAIGWMDFGSTDRNPAAIQNHLISLFDEEGCFAFRDSPERGVSAPLDVADLHSFRAV